MNLQKELAEQERCYQEWSSDNDDASGDLLVRAAFESGFVYGAEFARKEAMAESTALGRAPEGYCLECDADDGETHRDGCPFA